MVDTINCGIGESRVSNVFLQLAKLANVFVEMCNIFYPPFLLKTVLISNAIYYYYKC